MPGVRFEERQHLRRMTILKNILAVLGLIVVVFIGFGVFTGYSAEAFKEANKQEVESFVKDLSKRWRVEDIQGRVTNEFLAQVATPEGKEVIQRFSALGELESISDLEMPRYSGGTEATVAFFQFKGKFANGGAMVELELIEKEEKARVQRLNVTPIGEMPLKQTRYET